MFALAAISRCDIVLCFTVWAFLEFEIVIASLVVYDADTSACVDGVVGIAGVAWDYIVLFIIFFWL